MRSIVGTLALAILSTATAAAQHPAETDSIETRPLKNIMVSIGQDMNRIYDGLWYEDYEMIRMGAQAIADHPVVPPEQMAAIRKALDTRFEQFVGFDRQVHQLAVDLVDAAERRDLGDILELSRDIQQGCLSCHAAFRAEVRSALYERPLPSPGDRGR